MQSVRLYTSPPQNSPSSGANAVMHLHIVELTHILSFQAKVSEAECDDVTLVNRYIPYAQLKKSRKKKAISKFLSSYCKSWVCDWDCQPIQTVPVGEDRAWDDLDCQGNHMVQTSDHHIL